MLLLLQFIVGIPLLMIGAELLVRGAAALARAVGISALVVGLTVVAYGTSAPELAVSIQAAATGRADLSVGNVVGSNITNVLLVLGLSAALARLVISVNVVRYNVPLMIFVSIALLCMGLDGSIGRLDGVLLAGVALTYTVAVVVLSRKATALALSNSSGERPPRMTAAMIARRILQVITGLIALVLGARLLVDGGSSIARALGISELIIGLTIVAIGTSLPEIATSVLAAARGERDLAVGNAVGSNIFNILFVLGVSAICAPQGLPLNRQLLHFDIPIMVAVAVAALPIFALGHKLARWEGLLFLCYFAMYIAALCWRALNPAAQPRMDVIALTLIIPLILVTLSVLVYRIDKRLTAAREAQDKSETFRKSIVVRASDYR